MKNRLLFIIIIVLIVVAVLLLPTYSNFGDNKYNKDLLKLSENFENTELLPCKTIPVEEIFIPNHFLYFMSRPFSYSDIENYVKIENVQKTKYGFNIIFKSQNQILIVATDYNGKIINMATFGKTLYKLKDCLGIKYGMSLDEVKKIFPDSYFFIEYTKIFDTSSLKCEKPYIEIVCEDGTVFVIYFIEKNGVYYVENTLDFIFTDEDVIKSWEKYMG